MYGYFLRDLLKRKTKWSDYDKTGKFIESCGCKNRKGYYGVLGKISTLGFTLDDDFIYHSLLQYFNRKHFWEAPTGIFEEIIPNVYISSYLL